MICALFENALAFNRLGNPTTDVLERRFALLSGAHEMGALAVSSGTSATFNAIINLAAVGDNIVSSSALYGGTFTMFNDILPQMGIEVYYETMSLCYEHYCFVHYEILNTKAECVNFGVNLSVVAITMLQWRYSSIDHNSKV